MSILQSGNTFTVLAARFSPGDRGKAVSSSMGRKKKTQKSKKKSGDSTGVASHRSGPGLWLEIPSP
jgi:hypothetical protein